MRLIHRDYTFLNRHFVYSVMMIKGRLKGFLSDGLFLMTALSDGSIHKCHQLAFGQCADFSGHVFAVVENHQRRDTAYTEL